MKKQATEGISEELELGFGIEGKSTAQGTSIQASRVDSAENSDLI